MNTLTSLPVRPPHFADDRWYSADPGRLQREIETYFANAPAPLLQGKLIGLVAPHAGHFFSGHVAAADFVQLRPHAVETVILIGPDHYDAAPGEISTVKVSAWQTPLGDIPVDWPVLEALHHELNLVFLDRDQEHSLEIELPFLQVALHRFKLVPLMMGNQSLAVCRELAGALIKVLGYFRPEANFLLVASSDLSHFFDDDRARYLDRETLRFILNLDAPGLIRHVDQGRRHGQPLACGSGPIATILETAQAFGPTQAHLLKYATSADVYPRKERVVGYAAVGLTLQNFEKNDGVPEVSS
jgi:AmmeMemoRadiSam system protein B